MISLPERQQIVHWVAEASAAGARRHKACELLGIAPRTLERWRQCGGLKVSGFRRRDVQAHFMASFIVSGPWWPTLSAKRANRASC